MATEIKTIGVLTSGGDAPGMNAAIRAVVRTAIMRGYSVKGIRHGYNGLLTGDIIDMNLRSVSEIIHRGGTILYTARCLEFKTLEGQQRAAQACRDNGIDALVVIGGDGSFRGCKDMAAQGIPCVGLPGTIDNDIACSDYTIGYDTAMNTAVEMIDKLRDTTQSHDRCSVVEVMGRNAGYIALNTGIAVGALVTLIPEVPYDLERDVIAKMKATQKTGKQHFIIIIAEGVGHAQDLANEIQSRTGIDSALPCWAMCSAAVRPHCVTVSRLAVWATMPWSFCARESITAWSQQRPSLSLTTIFLWLFPCTRPLIQRCWTSAPRFPFNL